MASDKSPEFNRAEIELFREWFDAVQDLNPKYLEELDYKLAERLYNHLGMRVPDSIAQRL